MKSHTTNTKKVGLSVVGGLVLSVMLMAGTALAAGPMFSNIMASSTISGTGATITWSTDVPATSQVQYGTTTSYGTFSALLDTGAGTTSHMITLANLTPATLYHFALLGTASSTATTTATTTASTTSAMSADQTFTTMGILGTSSATSTIVATSSTTTATTTGTGMSTTTTGTSTATSTPSSGSSLLSTLILQLQSLQGMFPQFAGQIQGLINELLGSGTTIGNTASARIDQDGQTFTAGTSIDFGGHNFGHEETVRVKLNGVKVARAHADGGGNFSTGSLALPPTPGTYTYTFTGKNSGIIVQATIQLR